MKKTLIVLVITFLVIGLVACGAPKQSAEEAASENITENMTDEDVDIDIDDGGDSITIKTEKDEVTIESDEGGMPWPSDKLASSFPELKGVKIVAVIDASAGVTIGFEGCDKNTADAYIGQIKASGWNITLDVETGGKRVIIAGNDSYEYFHFGWNSEDGDGKITYGENS